MPSGPWDELPVSLRFRSSGIINARARKRFQLLLRTFANCDALAGNYQSVERELRLASTDTYQAPR
jgi:hypothetical protein